VITGVIFDIKRYAIHDGPGIRTTVFFKGCPLRCGWCHNPEGLVPEPEFILRHDRCAEGCNSCVTACPQLAIAKGGTSVVINEKKCDMCGICVDVCVYEAIEMAGRDMTIPWLLEELERDRVFFDESGGGITLSGGEPVAQIDFLKDLLDNLKRRKFNVALDTSGYVSHENLESIYDQVDHFLYDLKLLDDSRHEKHTGVSNKIILENLRKLSEADRSIAVRIPLLSDINDDDGNIHAMAEYLHSCRNIDVINLLPYHRGGISKHSRLRKVTIPNDFQPPSAERLENIRKFFSKSGFSVKIGG
jgi:pyruvate formate lyase activating enzyme